MKTRNQVRSGVTPKEIEFTSPASKKQAKSRELNRLRRSSPNFKPTIFVRKTISVPKEPPRALKFFHVLIGVTGSVATIKLNDLIRELKERFHASFNRNEIIPSNKLLIRVVATQNSLQFFKLDDKSIEILEDKDEWNTWKKRGDPVLHIELRKWADVFVIAPLDANTMAKMANGICDNLLTCIIRAWDMSKPLIYCPAMNTHMYEHPITKEHLDKLQSFGYTRIDSVEKQLACGDYGRGGMASTNIIAFKVIESLTTSKRKQNQSQGFGFKNSPTYEISSLLNRESSDDCMSRSTTKTNNTDKTIPTKITSKPTTSSSNQPKSKVVVNIRELSMRMKDKDSIDNSNINRSKSLSLGSLYPSEHLKVNVVHNPLKPVKTYSGADRKTKAKSTLKPKPICQRFDLKSNSRSEAIDMTDEEEDIDFDPSRLLEVTMITED